MGKVIVVGAVIVVVLLILLAAHIWTLRHRDRVNGDLGRSQEQALQKLLDEAAKVLSSLGVGPSIDDSDLLRPDSRTAVDNWLGRYHRFRRDTERA